MKGINKVIIVGILGQDPETRHSPSGTAFTNISVATSESWKDKQTGQTQERTEWHRIVFSARLAEIAGEYLKKGSKVYVEGSLRTRKWQDQQGQDRYTTEISARNMQMLDSRTDAASGDGGYRPSVNGQGGGRAANPPPVIPASEYGLKPRDQPALNQDNNYPGFDGFDDYIPFDVFERNSI